MNNTLSFILSFGLLVSLIISTACSDPQVNAGSSRLQSVAGTTPPNILPPADNPPGILPPEIPISSSSLVQTLDYADQLSVNPSDPRLRENFLRTSVLFAVSAAKAKELLDTPHKSHYYIDFLVANSSDARVLAELNRLLGLVPQVDATRIVNRLLNDRSALERLLDNHPQLNKPLIRLLTKYQASAEPLDFDSFERYLEVLATDNESRSHIARIDTLWATNHRIRDFVIWSYENYKSVAFNHLYQNLNADRQKALRTLLVKHLVEKAKLVALAARNSLSVLLDPSVTNLIMLLESPGTWGFTVSDLLRNAVGVDKNLMAFAIDLLKGPQFRHDHIQELVKKIARTIKSRIVVPWNNFAADALAVVAGAEGLNSLIGARILLAYDFDAEYIRQQAASPLTSMDDVKSLVQYFIGSNTDSGQKARILADANAADESIINVLAKRFTEEGASELLTSFDTNLKIANANLFDRFRFNRPDRSNKTVLYYLLEHSREAVLNLFVATLFREGARLTIPLSITQLTHLLLALSEHAPDKIGEALAHFAALGPASALESVSAVRIDQNGVLTTFDISTTQTVDMENTVLVVLPQNHWFAELYENNPLRGQPNIILTRPRIMNFELAKLGAIRNHFIYKINPAPAALSEQIPEINFQQVFAMADIRGMTLLGSGGDGTVYEFNLNGRGLAIKVSHHNNLLSEALQLEKYQYTNAVIPYYGYFRHANRIHLVMEKGEKDLREVIHDPAFVIADQVFLVAAERMKNLCQAGFEADDIKPENMVYTQAGIKIIDLGGGHSPGYDGNCQELATRSLVETYAKEDIFFRGGNDVNPAYEKYATRLYCERQALARCETVTTRDELYSRFGDNQKYQLLRSFNHSLSDWPLELGTRLRYPLALRVEGGAIDWNNYFNQKDLIGSKLCQDIASREWRRARMNEADARFDGANEIYCQWRAGDIVHNPHDRTEFIGGSFNVINDAFKNWLEQLFDFQSRKYISGVFFNGTLEDIADHKVHRFAMDKILQNAPAALSDAIRNLYNDAGR